MMRVQTFRCTLAKTEADALNRESGRVYTNTLVWHYRIYRRTGHWLSAYAAKRLEDFLGGLTTLHAHSRDAAQEGFYEACKVAKRQRQMGVEMRYPHRRHFFRTTTWKSTGIRIRTGVMLLSRARGGWSRFAWPCQSACKNSRPARINKSNWFGIARVDAITGM